MNHRLRASDALWRAHTARTAGERAYLAYAVVMVGVVAAAPVARAVWVSATSAEGIAALASPGAPGATALVVAALWAGALLLGRERGPIVLPPFLAHVLATSDLPRWSALRRPLLRAGVMVTAATTLTAGVIGAGLASRGAVDPLGAALFVAAGLIVGVVATVAWLAGQALPRAAVLLAVGVLAAGIVTSLAPAARPFTPWGWVGLAYPGGGTPQALGALTALGAALATTAPALVSRLGIATLTTQAARWDAATSLVTAMEVDAAAAVYRGRPHLGRRVRAVRAMDRLPLTFLFRDAIGAGRSPGRLIAGVAAIASAGALMALAFAPQTPGWLLGAVAGVLVFAGTGPLADGVRHAAHVASDLPLYGIDDGRLLLLHLLFPLTAVVLILAATALIGAVALGVGAAVPSVGALALGLLALVGRVGNALKGALPPALLAPIPTPMGDLGAGVRLVWALDGVLLAALAGAAAALVFTSPALPAGVAAAGIGVAAHRWRARR